MIDSRQSSLSRIAIACVLTVCCSLASLRAQALTPDQYRGCNYLPSTTLGISNVFNLLSPIRNGGTFDQRQTETEIQHLASLGINVVRVFPSFYAWVVDADDYMRNLRLLAKVCHQAGIKMTYVAWNTTSNFFVPAYLWVDPGFPTIDTTLRTLLDQTTIAYALNPLSPDSAQLASLGEPWHMVLHDSPGNGLFEAPYSGDMTSWPNNLKAKCAGYLDDVGHFFANDPVGRAAFAGYDLYNEPDCCFPDINKHLDFLAFTFKRLRAQHRVPGAPKFECTVGFADHNATLANHQLLLQNGVKQTYLSYHCYEPLATFTTVTQNHAALAQQLGIPVVCSEFYNRHVPGHLGNLASMLNDLNAGGLGGQVWGILSNNFFFEDPPGSDSFVRLDGMYLPAAVPNLHSTTDPIGILAETGALTDSAALAGW